MRIALLFRSYGPYHLARLADLRRRASVLALEFSDVDSEYDWRVSEAKQCAGVISLSKAQDGRVRSLEALDGWLKKFSPDVVAIPGYAEPLALLAACLCQGLGIPAVLMSDTHNLNDQRNPIRESLKRRVLSLFHSALVAGTPQKDYLAGLGFPALRISLGYDIVDNRQRRFCTAARRARLAQHDKIGERRSRSERLRGIAIEALPIPLNIFLRHVRLKPRAKAIFVLAQRIDSDAARKSAAHAHRIKADIGEKRRDMHEGQMGGMSTTGIKRNRKARIHFGIIECMEQN